jgi:hypothetical protein
MSWKFNPPPGWPEQPEGWVPPPGWTPDPNWPPPPAGWQFWVPAGTGATSAPPAAAPPPAAPPQPLTMVPPPLNVAAGSGPPYSSAPPTPTYSSGPGPGYSPGPGGPYASAPPYGAAARPSKPWFGQWWGILGLIALLLLGAAIGYGATRVALDASEEDSALGPAVTAYEPSHPDGYRGAPR